MENMNLYVGLVISVVFIIMYNKIISLKEINKKQINDFHKLYSTNEGEPSFKSDILIGDIFYYAWIDDTGEMHIQGENCCTGIQFDISNVYLIARRSNPNLGSNEYERNYNSCSLTAEGAKKKILDKICNQCQYKPK
jgi:hypothetical protein